MIFPLLACATPQVPSVEAEPEPLVAASAAPVAPVAPTLPAPPAEAGQPAQSLAARPAWESTAQYAPQAPASVRLNTAAHQGTADGLVTCLVEADARDPQGIFGVFAAPDLNARVVLGEAHMFAVGPEDSRSMRISAPLIHLEPGTPIQIAVEDRDVFKTEAVETVTGTYGGSLPFSIAGSRISADCGLVPADKVEELAAGLLAEVHIGLQGWDRSAHPDLQTRDLGGPELAVRQSLRESAGLVGWHDPRVVHLVTEHDRIMARYEAALTRSLAEVAAAAGDTWVDIGSLDARRGTLRCGEGATRLGGTAEGCSVILPIRAETPTPIEWPGTLGSAISAELVWSRGRAEVQLAGQVTEEAFSDTLASPVPPGEHTLVLATPWAASPEAPVLVRVLGPLGEWHYIPVD